MSKMASSPLGWWLGASLLVASGIVVGAMVAFPWGLSGAALVIAGAGLALVASRGGRQGTAASNEAQFKVGWPVGLLCGLAVAQYGAVAAGLVPSLAARTSLTDSLAPELPLLALGPVAGLGLLLGLWVAIRMSRRPTGTNGRVRASIAAVGMFLRSLGYGVLAGVLAYALTDRNALMIGLDLDESLMNVGAMPPIFESIQLVTSAQGTFKLLQLGIGLFAVGAIVELGAVIACWFLLPKGFRRVFWGNLDVVLVLGFAVATVLLPIRPDPDGPRLLVLPSIRLAVTALFATRALVRLIPVSLDVIERIGFRTLTAARMIRARKSGFLTTIGALSILAVSFSSCMLTTTLSVMGGFRNDLKEKILGNNAHVVVDRERGSFEGWDPILTTIREQEDVVAATPYVQGEVMITSATNLGGAILRGIDPESIGDVTDLPRNLRHGQLEYLSHPEQLLRLRPSEMGAGLLSPSLRDQAEEVPRNSLFDDISEVLDGAETDDSVGDDERADSAPEADGDAAVDEAERVAQEIDEFLLPDAATNPPAAAADEPDAPAADGETQDVLPGLIVGQELARTLRLHVGDEVNVVSPLGELGPAGPMPKSRPFRVAGIFYSGMYEFDMKMAYTTLGAAQRFLSLGDAISGIEVKIDDIDQAEPVARQVATAIAPRELRVRSWQEVNRNLFGALQLEKLAMFIMLGIAILVASFCIVGTLTLMVQEKRREVGILKAMGATSEQIVAVFMAQGLMIGLLGAATGLGLGYLSCYIAEHFGIHLNPEVYYIDKLPVHIDPSEFIVTGITAVVICLLATIYPAILGSRLTPLEALRDS